MRLSVRYTESVATQLAGWSEVKTFNISAVQAFFPHMHGTSVTELTTSFVSSWDGHASSTSSAASSSSSSPGAAASDQLSAFLVLGGDLSALSDVLASEAWLWEGAAAYISQDQYGGLLVATSAESIMHPNGYRIEAEDSESLMVSKTASGLHSWHANGAAVLSVDWMLDEWYGDHPNATASGTIPDDSACAPMLDTSGSAIMAYAGYVTGVAGATVPTRVSLLPHIMPSINGKRFLDDVGNIGAANAGVKLSLIHI